MHIAVREELVRQLSSLRLAASELEQYLGQPDQEINQGIFYDWVDKIEHSCVQYLHLTPVLREDMVLDIECSFSRQIKVLEIAIASDERNAILHTARGNSNRAKNAKDSARRIRDAMNDMIVRDRRSKMKLITQSRD
jgi:hypothetical protein